MDSITVSAAPLRQLLEALNGEPHLIREIQATRKIDAILGKPNPIDQLIDEFNAGIDDAKQGADLMTTFNPPRPTINDDMVRAAAAPVAAKLDGDVETIVKAYHRGMDGYELARVLDSYYGWTCKREDIDVLDEVEYEVDKALREAERQWIETHNIQPPYPIGTRIMCRIRRETGVIDSINEYTPGAYSIKPDGQDDEKANHCRWVCKFEAVEPVEEQTP